jgi:hypothetical protein
MNRKPTKNEMVEAECIIHELQERCEPQTIRQSSEDIVFHTIALQTHRTQLSLGYYYAVKYPAITEPRKFPPMFEFGRILGEEHWRKQQRHKSDIVPKHDTFLELWESVVRDNELYQHTVQGYRMFSGGNRAQYITDDGKISYATTADDFERYLPENRREAGIVRYLMRQTGIKQHIETQLEAYRVQLENEQDVTFVPDCLFRKSVSRRDDAINNRSVLLSAESIIDRLAGELLAEHSRDYTDCITIVSGDDVRKAYAVGFGSHSCMTGDNGSRVELYRLNPKQVQLMKFECGDWKARALLWNCDDGSRVLDRVYGRFTTTVTSAIKKWRKTNDIVCQSKCGDVTVTLPTMPDDMSVPYMDTMYYGELVGDGIRIGNYSFSRYTNSLDCTEGGPYCEERSRCENCDSWVHIDDAYCNDSGYTYCEDCYHEIYSRCESCYSECYSEDMRVVESNGNYVCDDCYDSQHTECVSCNTELHVDDVHCTDAGDDVCEDCVSFCDECNVTTTTDDVQSAPNGDAMCDSCFESKVTDCPACNEDYMAADAVILEGHPHYASCCPNCESSLMVSVE